MPCFASKLMSPSLLRHQAAMRQPEVAGASSAAHPRRVLASAYAGYLLLQPSRGLRAAAHLTQTNRPIASAVGATSGTNSKDMAVVNGHLDGGHESRKPWGG
eukprot:TRINITY_DN44686_c0_g1_i1.p1 TRINITY_DN44686_c0_g1~~TRINITY_DN44686_c0_g1_i1.p1  ORF type:complete len:102 (+),score=11.14 TRINITY_DN44686_c0_g1_i1:110-415(+)